MGLLTDLRGIIGTTFKVGLTGPNLKNIAGALSIRNTGDTADAVLTASQLKASGDNIVINSDAVSSGADYQYTVGRPAAGMTANLSFVLPPTQGTSNQVLQTDGSGNSTWTSLSSNLQQVSVDTTLLSFGSTSPLTLFTLPANAEVYQVEVQVDTAFTGSPSLSIGITGTTSKYVASNQTDLSSADTYQISPSVVPSGTAENLIATYSAGGATAGSARITVQYSIPV